MKGMVKVMAKRKKKKKKSPIVLIILLAVLFVGSVYGMNKFWTSSSPYIKNNATPTPIAAHTPMATMDVSYTATSTPKTSDKPTATSSSEETAEKLAEYENDEYSFSCPYPQKFSQTTPAASDTLLSLRSSDGAAYENIFASDATGQTPAVDMRDFVSKYPTAKIVDNRIGNTYYYILIKVNNEYIYRYVAYGEDTVKGFEFGYNESFESEYLEYPKQIKSGFSYTK